MRIKNFFNGIKESFSNDSFNKLRACFLAIDLISSIWKTPEDLTKNKPTSDKSIEFIREVMGKVNPLYQELAAIIYVWFRHSLAHSWMPDTGLELKDKKVIVYNIGNKKHIEFEKVEDDSNTWKFHFNADQFQEDIFQASNNWVNTSAEVDTIFKNYKDVVKESLTPIKECELVKKRIKYNLDKDFAYIHEILKILSKVL